VVTPPDKRSAQECSSSFHSKPGECDPLPKSGSFTRPFSARKKMKTRILISLLTVLITSTIAHAQESRKTSCPIEELAIEAALGETTAQYNLAVEFFRGERVPRDYAKAAKLWRSASDAGDVAASNNLGYLKYYVLPGVSQDYAEAIRLWRLAAERGNAESQVHLANAYYDARYLPVDLVEAYAWASASKHNANRGDDRFDNKELDAAVARDAEKTLADLHKRLTPAELARAEKRATLYIEKFPPR
jgi:hypothetical protein